MKICDVCGYGHIDDLGECTNPICRKSFVGNSELVKHLQKHIADLEASLSTLREANRWIPISERLPYEGQEILVFDGYDMRQDFYYQYLGFRKLVTHWRPLPEGLEEE